jgi:hypothetical protein
MTQNDAKYKQNIQPLSGLAMAGDATGTTGSATVTAIRGNAIQNATPTIGDFLIWNNAASQWQPGIPSNGPLIAGLVTPTGPYNVTSTDTIIVTSHSVQMASPDTVGRILLISFGVNIGATFPGKTDGVTSSISTGMVICYDGINWSSI